MTIAAGFAHKDGVLLCADTQQETDSAKFHEAKIFRFDWKGRSGAFAFAGNSAFATSTIQRCITKIEASSEDPLSRFELVLDKEYKRVVYAHPECQTNANVHFWIIAAIPSRQGGVELYASHETTITKEDSFKCVGIGEALARRIFAYSSHGGMSEHEALRVSAYALALVKKYIPSCGGPSSIMSLRHDGSIGEFNGYPEIDEIERHAGVYHMLANDLFFQHMNSYGSEDQFEGDIHRFVQHVRNLRSAWVTKDKSPWGVSTPRD
jgi:hypothetical protein